MEALGSNNEELLDLLNWIKYDSNNISLIHRWKALLTVIAGVHTISSKSMQSIIISAQEDTKKLPKNQQQIKPQNELTSTGDAVFDGHMKEIFGLK